MEKGISPDEVRVAVGRFWNAFAAKSRNTFPEMYFANALVLSSTGLQAEPGRLAIVRRMRKFFDSPGTLSIHIGQIEVQLLGEKTALATYFYVFEATETGRDGSRVRKRTPFARATHIFQRDEQGNLRILHEHLSSATAPETENISEGMVSHA